MCRNSNRVADNLVQGDGTRRVPALGKPTLAGASVTAEVVGVTQGPKLVVQKLRRRKTLRRRTGHRQMFTKVRINKIAVG
ncbi:MAG: 50S ribosomal protein L21 [Planctomycetes bacterium]|nr:50S ribosomal protein L21 [Planctomycetota bacterium]